MQKLSKNDAETSREKSPKSLNTNDLREFTRKYIRDIRDIITTTTEKEKEKTAADDDNPDIRSPQKTPQPIAPAKHTSHPAMPLHDRTGRSSGIRRDATAYRKSGGMKRKHPATGNEACQQGKRTWFPTETSLIFRQNEWHFQPKREAFQAETSGISGGNKRLFGRKPVPFRRKTNRTSNSGAPPGRPVGSPCRLTAFCPVRNGFAHTAHPALRSRCLT